MSKIDFFFAIIITLLLFVLGLTIIVVYNQRQLTTYFDQSDIQILPYNQ